MRYMFGDYILDPQRRELCCRGQPVKLQPKAFDLLTYLMVHRDHAATKQELLAHLWPNQYVSDATLSTCIKLARQAVGDSERARWCIQTLHGRGYRWVADVREQPDPPAVVELLPPPLHTESRHAVPPPLDGERKLATVLACTIANASALAATLEPEAWYTLRQQFFACAQQEVQRYEGTIQHFADDGFLAFFGVPVAHEDHAQRAVLAAVSLHARVHQQHVHPGSLQGEVLAVCIGVHTGQVVVGRIEDDPRLTALSMGDTTHLAHRLLHLAAPGAVLLSEATRQLLHGAIRLEAIGPVPRHGAAVPVQTYKALGIAFQTLPWQRGRVLSPFVGRAREMAVLEALLVQVEESRGQVAGIVGEPGMGKSRLLYEFRRQVRERQYAYLAGQCVSYGCATPYLPLLDLLRHAWGLIEADAPETLTAKVHEGLHAVGMAPDAWGPPFLQTLPDTPARAQHELVQTILGPALLATRGYGAPEVEQTYTRARELCQQVWDTLQLFPVLLGLTAFYMVRAEYQTARTLGEQCLRLAQRVQDPARIMTAQGLLGLIVFLLGEFVPARTSLEQGLALYNRQPRSWWIDNRVGYLSATAWTLWMLGYPDQALGRSLEALARAQDVSHPFSLGYALYFTAQLHHYRREVHATQARAEAAITLSRAQGFPTWLANGTILQGWALAAHGQGEAGVAQIRQGIAAYRAAGEELIRPYFLALLAESYGQSGQAEAGLRLLAEALATVEHTGERSWEAEVYRIKGELLLGQAGPDVPQAETCFQQSITVARRQQAKSWELRASLSLSRLWQQQGKRGEARKLLAPIYGWFTEGFNTGDLQEAKALLEELGG